MPEPRSLDDEARRDRVARAAETWAQELVDLGSRNPLLHYKDLKTGTLDLSAAPAAVLERLLAGDRVRLSDVAADGPAPEDTLARLVRSAASLARRIMVLDEEQGVDAGRAAVGFVRVTRPGAAVRAVSGRLPLVAPLLLWRVELKAVGTSGSDFTLRLASEECEPNPVLLHALQLEGGPDRTVLAAKLADLIAEQDGEAKPQELARRCLHVIESEAADARLAFELADRVVIGTFSFEKMPMVDDLRDNLDLLVASDIVAALAGDGEAAQSLAGDGEANLPGSDGIPPQAEYLVHDADSSQQRVVEAVLAGQHIVVDGPPGTGKSQTIANLIAALAARGKRVLFVAEKRAAIEAVTDRLAKAKLDRLVLDLHEQKIDKRGLAQRLQHDLDRAAAQPLPDVTQLHHRLGAGRARLLEYHRELHRSREPWGVSAFGLQASLLGLPDTVATRLRLPERLLTGIDDTYREQLESDLRDLVSNGGLRFHAGGSPWSGSTVRNKGDAAAVGDHLSELLGGRLTSAWRDLDALLAAARLQRPEQFAHGERLLDLLAAVQTTLTTLGPHAFGPDLPDLVWATGDRSWRRAHPRRIGLLARRRLVKQACAMSPTGRLDRRAAHIALRDAEAQQDRWRSSSLDGSGPAAVPRLPETVSAFGEATRRLAAVAACLNVPDWQDRSREDLDVWTAALDAARAELVLVPRWVELVERLVGHGLAPLLDELVGCGADEEAAVLRLRWLWSRSVLEQIWLQVPALGAFSGRAHAKVVQAFRRDDRDHLRGNADRVRRLVAERLKAARDGHPDQDRLIREQAGRRGRHLPTRRLVERTGDVLLALYPCWAMSPLIVSRLLPARRLFDVVIFDEASQVEPENAIPSIMRARQVVVAGDEKQLPPTSFFRALREGTDLADPDADEEDGEDSLRDYESLLTRIRALLPDARRHRLTWHYRSLDERLVAFSNVEIYDGSLVTFPSASVTSPVSLEVVDGVAQVGEGGSAREEVARVVELALEFAEAEVARAEPRTLGIITMGVKHAARVERALKAALAGRPHLVSFFSADRGPGRRVFVKSIEQVQGDERDHIILSVGYARTPSGRAPTNFGPVSQQNGKRRLNVAVTRARRSMTVVSSFRPEDMDVSRASQLGPVLLRKFLEFADRGGDADALAGPGGDIELNPFEQQVLDAVRHAGVPVQPQWGVGRYRIDFALAHPDRPTDFVLAVEADGRAYHSSDSARDRDRLRQEHLERLGWRFHRLWSTSWFRDQEGELAAIVEHWSQACRDADRRRGSGTRRPVPSAPAPPERPREPAPATPARGPRPPVPVRRRIEEYTDAELLQVCRWLLSDGLPVPRVDRLAEAIRELGFTRRGSRIVERVTEALQQAELDAQQEGDHS